MSDTPKSVHVGPLAPVYDATTSNVQSLWFDTTSSQLKFCSGNPPSCVWTAVPGGSAVADWDTILNRPTTFTPSPHTHLSADITDLATGSIPAGVICMWGGLLANIPSGWALCDGANGTPDLRAKFIKGSTGEPGATGGSDSHAHTTGTYAVSAHSGTAVADHASHTHTYTQVPNHVHVQSVNSATTGGLSGYTPDTSTGTSVASGYSTANPTGGVATATTNGPNATLTHSVTQPANHTLSGSSDSVNHEPAFYALAFIQKL
jgi:hypothetical protein